MLARVPPAVIARLRFPLGEEHKRDVRAEAEARGLAAGARAREPGRVLPGRRGAGRVPRAAGRAPAPGEVVDEAGGVLGTHAGAASFTTGQRRGLGIAAPAPLYVLRAEPAAGLVVGRSASRAARSRCARPCCTRGRARRGQAARTFAGGRRDRRARRPSGLRLRSTSPPSGWPRGRRRCSTTRLDA